MFLWIVLLATCFFLRSLRTMGVWLNNQEEWHSREAMYRRGVVYYMRDGKVCANQRTRYATYRSTNLRTLTARTE